MDYEAVNLTGSAAGLQGALNSAITAINAYNAATQSVTKVNLEYNNASKETVQVMERMLDAHTKLITTTTTSANGKRTEANAISVVTNELKKQAEAMKQLEQAERNAAAVRAAQAVQATIPTPQNVNSSQLIAYQQNLNKIVTMFQTGKINAEQFAAVLRQVGSATPNLSGFSSGMTQAFQSLQQMRQATGQLAATAKEAGLSMKNFINIGEALLFKQALSSISGELTNSVRAASELQIKIAEIRTISQGAQSTTQQWNDMLLRVSNNTGIAVKDVAAGAYEALSNQVSKGAAETERFLTTAGEFARTTVTSMKDSVDLLSSVKNSYNLSANELEGAAASLFKTIDLGRVRGEELGNSLGRVIQPASALGVSLHEVEAALTTLTREGVTARDAQTQLLNIFTRLLKPTGDLKDLLASWGTPTAQAAVDTFGFVNVLQKLGDAAKGSAGELANLFPNTRGLRGIIGITQGGNQSQYNQDLAAIQNAGSNGEYDLAKKLRAEPAADEMVKELNRVKNFFIDDFGNSLINTGKTINEMLGSLSKGFSNIVENVTGLKGAGAPFESLSASIASVSKILIVATEVWISFKAAQYAVMIAQGAAALATAAWTAATTTATVALTAEEAALLVATGAIEAEAVATVGAATATASFGATLAVALPVVTAIGAALYILYDQMNQNNTKTKEYTESLARLSDLAAKQRTTGRQDAASKAISDYTSQQKADSSPYKQGIAAEIAASKDGLADFKEQALSLDTEVGDSFKNYADKIKEAVNEMKSAVENAKSAVQSTNKYMMGLDDTIDRIITNINEKYASEGQKLAILVNRGNAALQKAYNLARSGDPAAKTEIDRLIGEAARDQGQYLDKIRQLNAQADKAANDAAWKAMSPAMQRAVGKELPIGSKGKPAFIDPVQAVNRKDFAGVLSDAKAIQDLYQKSVGEVGKDAAAKSEEMKRASEDLKKALDDWKKFTDKGPLNKEGTGVDKKFWTSPADQTLDIDKFKKEQDRLTQNLRQASDRANQAASVQNDKLKSARPEQAEARQQKFMDDLQKRAELETKMFKDVEARNTLAYEDALKRRRVALLEDIQLKGQISDKQNAEDFRKAQDIIANTPKTIGEKGGPLDDMKKVMDAMKALADEMKLPGRMESQFAPGNSQERNQAKFNSNVANAAIANLQTRADTLMSGIKDALKNNQPERAQKFQGELAGVMTEIKQFLEVEKQARIDFFNNQSKAGLSADAAKRQLQELNTPTEARAVPGNQNLRVFDILESFENATKQLNDSLKEYSKAQDTVKKLQGAQGPNYNFQQEISTVADAMSKGLTPATNDASKALQDFANVLKSVKPAAGANMPGATGSPPLSNDDARPPQPTQGYATGGIVGGKPGVDTNLAWLTRGEYVMPVAQTAAFLPILRAMHHGTMIPRGAGGNVITTVGDINISVQGPQTPDKTVRQIGEQLRREIKRGNIIFPSGPN